MFTATELAGRHWMARDYRGFPCLVIAVAPETSTHRELRTEYLHVHYFLHCEIHSALNGSSLLATYTVLRCTSPIERHQQLFVSLLDTIIAAAGSPPTAASLQRVIQSLVAMFSALSLPARTVVQGLWGELLLIACSSNPARMLHAWHATVSDDFDFSEGAERIEVKTTASRKREHVFSLEQLRVPEKSIAQVASLIVRPSGGGARIADLVSEIEERIAGEYELHLKLHSLIVQSLGVEWDRVVELRFDRELAIESLKFFATEAVPQITCDVPDAVSHVSFVSDLSAAKPMGSPRSGSIFAAAQPLRIKSKYTAALPGA